MFCLSDVFTSTQGTFEDSIEKHQGSVNALSNSWNFILRRTETNAFQFESRFLILSNFSSLHYFKKIPFQIAEVGIWSIYFFHLLPTKHIDFNFLYLYSYGRFLSHLNRKQILLTHWNIGWLWRRMHRLEDADPSIVALFFLQDYWNGNTALQNGPVGFGPWLIVQGSKPKVLCWNFPRRSWPPFSPGLQNLVNGQP